MNKIVQAGTSQATITKPAASLEAALNRLAEIAVALDARSISRDAHDLASRLKDGRFYLACVGQFKRGKSTLLNALVGERLLPAGITPITSVPTIVRYGAPKGARIRLRDNEWREVDPATIVDYVSEESNPENHRGIAAVEVFCPSLLLASGMCLVDTPGLGSVFSENTATTEEFLPHIDAAIIVLGSDPPIAGAEVDLIVRIAPQTANLLFVLNKSDKSSTEERETAKTFARRVLENKLQRPIGPIYELSAEEILNHTGSQRDWHSFLAALNDLAASSRRALVLESTCRGLQRITRQLTALVSNEADALQRPIAESEARIDRLRHSIDKAQQSLRDLTPLFAAEQNRLASALLTRRATFLTETNSQAGRELTEQLSKIPHRFGPEFRTQANQLALEIAKRHILPWLECEQTAAEHDYQATAARFAAIGNEFLGKFAADQSDDTIPAQLSTQGFSAPSRFSFESFHHVARPASPIHYLADIFLGAFGGFSVIEADVQEFMAHLLETNSMRVHSDTMDRLEKSRGKLQLEISKALTEAREIAQRTLDRARASKLEGEKAVGARLEKLQGINLELVRIGGPSAAE